MSIDRTSVVAHCAAVRTDATRLLADYTAQLAQLEARNKAAATRLSDDLEKQVKETLSKVSVADPKKRGSRLPTDFDHDEDTWLVRGRGRPQVPTLHQGPTRSVAPAKPVEDEEDMEQDQTWLR